MKCARCRGQMYRDADRNLACLQCGHVEYTDMDFARQLATYPLALPKSCKDCGVVLSSHGSATRCRSCYRTHLNQAVAMG